jgi:hypothetical protein
MVKVWYESATLGPTTLTLVHQILMVEVKVVAHQPYLSMARPWQESEIQSVAVMLVPPEVQM